MRPSERLNSISRETILAALARFSAPGQNGCIEWQGQIAPNGYGRAYIAGVTVPAHRAALVASIGPVSPEIDACHKCDNRRCINTDHLFPGTRAENMKDCSAKKRLHAFVSPLTMPRCERHGSAKLTLEQAKAIRAEHGSTYSLARKYGVNPSTIGRIKRGELWSAP